MADDVLFNIKGDSSSAVSAAENIVTALNNVNNAINNLDKSIGVIDALSEAFDNLYSATNLAAAGIEGISNQLEAISGTADSSNAALGRLYTVVNTLNFDPALTALTALASGINDIIDYATLGIDTLSKFGVAANSSAGNLSPLASANTQAASTADKLAQASAQAASDLQKQAQAAADVDAQLMALENEEPMVISDLDTMAASTTSASDAADGLLMVAQDLEQALSNLLNKVEEVTLNLKDLADQALTAASAEEDMAAAIDVASTAMGAQNNMMYSTATASNQAKMGMIGYGNAARTAEEESASLNDVFGPGAMNLVMMATMIGMVGGSFLKMGMDAQTAIAHITGLADQSLSLSSNSKQLDSYINQLSSDAVKYGISLADAANGMYYIISAGFKGSDALTVLNSSMEAAAATGTKMDTVSNALTSIMNAYSLSAGNAAEVTNKMVAAVTAGKQDFGPFANAIGPVAAAAEHAGVSISEMMAAEAALTEINPRVRQDGQQLANLFNVLSNDGQKVVDMANAMGAHLTLASFEAMPLMEKLQTLANIAKGDTTPAFRQLLQTQVAATAAYDLLSHKTDVYDQILQAVTHSQGALDTAFQQTSQTIQFQLNRISAALSVISYDFVVLIGPVVTPILKKIADMVDYVATHFEQLKPIIIGVATALTVVFVGAIIAVMGFLASFGGPILGVAFWMGILAYMIVSATGYLMQFESWVRANFPALFQLGDILRSIGLYIKTEFIQAWQGLVGLFKEFEQWAKEHITPAVKEIINNLIKLAVQIASQVIPALERFKTQVLEPIGKYIMANVVPAIGKFIEKALELAKNFSADVPGAIQKFLDILGKIAGGVAGAGTAFGILRTYIAVQAAGGIMQFLAQAGGPLIIWLTTTLPQAFAGIGTAIGAFMNPIGLVVAIIAVLIGYFIYLSTQSKNLQDAWASLKGPLTDVWNAVKQAVSDVVKSFKENLGPVLEDLKKEFAPLMPVIKDLAIALGVVLIAAIGILLEAIAGLAVTVGKSLAGVIEAFRHFMDFIQDAKKLFEDFMAALFVDIHKTEETKKAWAKVWEDIKKVFVDVWGVITSLWHASFDALISGVMTFVNGVIKFFQHLYDALVGNSIVPDMLNAIVKEFRDFPGKVEQVIQQWVQNVIKWFQQLADKLVGHSIVPDMINAIVKAFQDLPQKVQQVIQQWIQDAVKQFQQFAQNVLQTIQGFAQGFVQTLSQGLQSAQQVVQQGIQGMAKPFTDLIQNAQRWGADFIGHFAQGIQSQMSGLMMSVMGMANSIASYLHFSKPDVGPLADVDTWMPDFGSTLATGLNAQVSKVGAAARNIAGAIGSSTPNLSSYSNIAVNAGSSEQTMILRQILQEIKSGNQQSGNRGTIGYQIPSTELGAINQQFNYYNASTQAATLYNQINTLGGLAQEYSARGSLNGLGF